MESGENRRTCKTQYFPPFFFLKISSASSSYPGAITPSETSLEIIFAVGVSTLWDRAMKSPKDDIRSAPSISFPYTIDLERDAEVKKQDAAKVDEAGVGEKEGGRVDG